MPFTAVTMSSNEETHLGPSLETTETTGPVPEATGAVQQSAIHQAPPEKSVAAGDTEMAESVGRPIVRYTSTEVHVSDDTQVERITLWSSLPPGSEGLCLWSEELIDENGRTCEDDDLSLSLYGGVRELQDRLSQPLKRIDGDKRACRILELNEQNRTLSDALTDYQPGWQVKIKTWLEVSMDPSETEQSYSSDAIIDGDNLQRVLKAIFNIRKPSMTYTNGTNSKRVEHVHSDLFWDLGQMEIDLRSDDDRRPVSANFAVRSTHEWNIVHCQSEGDDEITIRRDLGG